MFVKKEIYMLIKEELCKKIHEHLDGKYYGLIGDEKK